MRTVYADVLRRGGVAATFELLRDGHTSYALTRAVRSGEVVRARQGHYTIPELHPHETCAVRVGGRLTGLSGARRHGIWSPTRAILHIAVPPNARALRTPHDPRRRLAHVIRPGVIVTWTAQPEAGTRSLVGVRGCLIDIARREPARVAFAAAESAIHLGTLTRPAWRRILSGMPQHLRDGLRDVDGMSESGGESLARFGMLGARIPHRQQVRITGAGRVDFLVGSRLVIEVDGAEFHTSREQFEEDRRRDAVLSRLGYRVLRFSYVQVSDRWPEVLESIAAAMSRGDHLG